MLATGLFVGSMSMFAAEPKATADVQFGNSAVTANAVVNDDYSFTVDLPDQDKEFDLRDDIVATLTAGSKSRTITYNTGIVIPAVETLAEWQKCEQLPAGYVEQCHAEVEDRYNDSIKKRVTVKFEDAAEQGFKCSVANFYSYGKATFNVTLTTNGGTKSLQYVVEGEGDDVLNGGVFSGCSVSEMMNFAKSEGNKGAQVSGILLKSGTSIHYGKQTMDLKNDVTLARKDLKMDKILQLIHENASIVPDGDPANKIIIRLPEGSSVKLGGEAMTTKTELSVEIDLASCASATDIVNIIEPTFLGTLFEYAKDNKRTDFFTALVNEANAFAGLVKGHDVNVTAMFAQPEWNLLREGLTKGQVGTFCSEYGFKQLRGGFVYSLESCNSADPASVTEVTLVEAKYPLVAGQAYIFFATADKLETLPLEDGEEGSLYEGLMPGWTLPANGLIGYLSDGLDPEDDKKQIDYVAGQNAVISGGKLQRCGKNSYVPNGRAYVDFSQITDPVNAPVSARRMRIAAAENSATDLENIEEVAVVKALVNGELYIIKNGVRYNVQGQIVK